MNNTFQIDDIVAEVKIEKIVLLEVFERVEFLEPIKIFLSLFNGWYLSNAPPSRMGI
jgi:hypothetical protein